RECGHAVLVEHLAGAGHLEDSEPACDTGDRGARARHRRVATAQGPPEQQPRADLPARALRSLTGRPWTRPASARLLAGYVAAARGVAQPAAQREAEQYERGHRQHRLQRLEPCDGPTRTQRGDSQDVAGGAADGEPGEQGTTQATATLPAGFLLTDR